jgi:hypothetical protein
VTRLMMAGLLALGMLLSTLAAAQDAGQYPLAESAGVIQELDFGGNAMVIDGMSYQVALDVTVEIGGSHGAFTMLRPDMRVYFEFLQISPRSRRVTMIRELPDGVALDGV